MAGRSAIGLDIGTSGVRAAELSFGKGQVTLEKFGQVALPEGAVRDGEVVDPDAVAAAVKQLWAHTKFSSKKVVIGVANQKVIVRQVDLPWMPPDELKKSLAFQVQDFVPMPVEQAVLDFHPLEELTAEGGNRVLRGLLVAASRDMVNASLEAVQKAGLTPRHGRPDVLRRHPVAGRRRPPRHGRAGRGAGRRRRPRHQHRRTPGRRPAVRPHPADGRPGRHRRRRRADGRPAGAGRGDEAAARPRHAPATAWTSRPPPASSRPSAPRSSTRCAARSTTTSPPAARRPISRLVLTGGGARLGGLAQRLQVTTRVAGRGRHAHAQPAGGPHRAVAGADRVR